MTTKTEWRRALARDEDALSRTHAAIATLRAGGTVENLTLPNALRSAGALAACIDNKRRLIATL